MRLMTLGRLLVPLLAIGTLVLGTETGAAAAGACPVPAPVKVPAKTRVVGTGTAGSCTFAALRNAVRAGGHVVFRCGGAATIAVTSELQVSNPTVIDGGGTVTLDGRRSGHIMRATVRSALSVRNLHLINGGGPSTDRGGAIVGDYANKLEVIGSTFANNSVTDAGGAISTGSASSLTVIDSTFRDNRSGTNGGAIYSLLTRLNIIGTTLAGNSAGVNGGAILTDGAAVPGKPGTISICGTTFRSNTAHGSGGGGFFWAYAPQKIIVDRTTFEGNAAATKATTGEGFGGAARLSVGINEKSGTLIVRNSSVRSNDARIDGGAFYLDCPPTCQIRNTTFYKNTAGDFGGAVFGDGHHDKNVTYAANRAGDQGGATFGGRNVYDNTVFTGNRAQNQWGMAQTCNVAGKGHHVVQWGAKAPDNSQKCAPTVTAKNPRLTAPAGNRGSTLSMMPAADSPLLNAGADCEAADQRGVVRTAGRCDIGAVQRTAVVAPGPAVKPSAGASPSATPSAAAITLPPRTATSSKPTLTDVAQVGSHSPAGFVPLAVGIVVITITALISIVPFRKAYSQRFVGGHRPARRSHRRAAGVVRHRSAAELRPVTPLDQGDDGR